MSLTSNSHVSEEKPARDEGLIGLAGRLDHDVKIRWVEAQSSGRQTVSDQVDPQQLYRDKSLWHAHGSSQEDAHHLTNVGADQVADELLHVVVDGTALLNGSHNGGKVVISQHHLRSRLGYSSSRSHGNTDLSLLQSRSIIHTITSLYNIKILKSI